MLVFIHPAEKVDQTLQQLYHLSNDLIALTEIEACAQFLVNIENEHAVMIVSGCVGKDLVPSIHSSTQVDSILIVCINLIEHQPHPQAMDQGEV